MGEPDSLSVVTGKQHNQSAGISDFLPLVLKSLDSLYYIKCDSLHIGSCGFVWICGFCILEVLF